MHLVTRYTWLASCCHSHHSSSFPSQKRFPFQHLWSRGYKVPGTLSYTPLFHGFSNMTHTDVLLIYLFVPASASWDVSSMRARSSSDVFTTISPTLTLCHAYKYLLMNEEMFIKLSIGSHERSGRYGLQGKDLDL